jgi:hypothetical protein
MKNGGHCLRDLAVRRSGRVHAARSSWGQIAYALGAGLAWVSQIGAFAWYGAIALYFVFPHGHSSAVKSDRSS